MLIALTHPLIDIIVSCSPELLKRWDLTHGSYGIVDSTSQDELLAACHALPQRSLIGGSAANSAVAASTLGIPTTIIGLIGNDTLGRQMHSLLSMRGIKAANPLVAGKRTGSCLSLITPDGERTMRTCHGVVNSLGPEHIDEQAIADATWLLVEGYFLTASEMNRNALHHALTVAKKHNTKTALTLSAEFVVSATQKELLEDIIPKLDLVFANQGEALLLTSTSETSSALDHLSRLTPSVVITCGQDGAVGVESAQRWQIPAARPPGPVVDTTGAGDAFAGAYLAGLMHGHPPTTAARGAAMLAAMVVTQHGAQLPHQSYVIFDAR
jgi:sugar/nucleoside kinase (ribokinase family)